MTKLQVVVDGQYGSVGKGHIAGYLAAQEIAPLCIRVGGGNAGHSVVNPHSGLKHALRQIPAGAVTNPRATLAIAAGSEVDYAVLANEVENLEADGIKIRDRLYIDPQATAVQDRHAAVEQEVGLTALCGSTGKGIGAARAERIMRQAELVGQIPEFGAYGRLEPTAPLARMHETYSAVQIEGTQGYGLGLHAGHYPFTTSGNCTAIDFLAAAQINPWTYVTLALEIFVVFRPHPIRVAGNSGPLLGETTWEALGLEPEYTTVTKKMRRVGAWDGKLATDAIAANGGYSMIRHARNPVKVALTMADQISPALKGATDPDVVWFDPTYQQFAGQMLADCGRRPLLVTTSDRTCVDMAGWEALG